MDIVDILKEAGYEVVEGEKEVRKMIAKAAKSNSKISVSNF